MRKSGWIIIIFVALLGVSSSIAQVGTCTADVLLALARANTACLETERGMLCMGNGTLNVQRFDTPTLESVTVAGSFVPSGQIQVFEVTSADGYGVMSAQLQLNMPENQPRRAAHLLAFGEVRVQNAVAETPFINVTAEGALNIREAPDILADLIDTFPLRTVVVANGRTEDNTWLRVFVPGEEELGWVRADLVTTTSSIEELSVVTTETQFLRPFQSMTITTGHDDAPCEGTPSSAVLIQAPSIGSDALELTVNGVDFRTSGTISLQASEETGMTVTVLDGFTWLAIEGRREYVPAGARVSIDLDSTLNAQTLSEPEPLITDFARILPLNNLTTRVQVPLDLTEADIQHAISIALAAPRPTPNPQTIAQQTCIRTASRTIVTRAGPGLEYPILSEDGIRAGDRLYPTLSVRLSDGREWWQLQTSVWIEVNERNATSSQACPPLPVSDIVPAPSYNFLSLENCETMVGGLRRGQSVEIEFVDNYFTTLAEAQAAPQIDPGTITINGNRIPVYAGEIAQASQDRYIRRFYGYWTAEPGTYRIVGGRLTYSVICDITVPAG